jgi:hypothetical protein
MSFASPPFGSESAPAGGGGGGGGGGGARAVRPSSPNGLQARLRCTSAGRRRKAGARATSPASPITDGGVAQSEALEPRQGASAKGGGERRGACIAQVHAADNQPGHGRQRARAQPLRQPRHAFGAGCSLAEAQHLERRHCAGSTDPSVHSRARSSSERPLLYDETIVVSRSSLQLRSPSLRHNAAAASWSALSCCRSAGVSAPQLATDAAKVYGDARIEHVAQLAEDGALLVTAQLRQRHRGCCARRAPCDISLPLLSGSRNRASKTVRCSSVEALTAQCDS